MRQVKCSIIPKAMIRKNQIKLIKVGKQYQISDVKKSGKNFNLKVNTKKIVQKQNLKKINTKDTKI